jgi:hypothetical protein
MIADAATFTYIGAGSACAISALALWFAEADLHNPHAVAALSSPGAALISRGDLLQKCFSQPQAIAAAAVNLMSSTIVHAPHFLLSSSSSNSLAPVTPLLSMHIKSINRLLSETGPGGCCGNLSLPLLMCAGHLISSMPLVTAMGPKVTASVTAGMVAFVRKAIRHDPQSMRDALLPCLDMMRERGACGVCWTEGEWNRRLGVQVIALQTMLRLQHSDS